MVEFLNNIEDKLSFHYGCKGALLSYLKRDNVEPSLENEYSSTSYATVQDKIVTRALHVTLVNGI